MDHAQRVAIGQRVQHRLRCRRRLLLGKCAVSQQPVKPVAPAAQLQDEVDRICVLVHLIQLNHVGVAAKVVQDLHFGAHVLCKVARRVGALALAHRLDRVLRARLAVHRNRHHPVLRNRRRRWRQERRRVRPALRRL
eukprot:298582-Chlamydomonas_euryale.AAC.1